jgi:hypothetical protein
VKPEQQPAVAPEEICLPISRQHWPATQDCSWSHVAVEVQACPAEDRQTPLMTFFEQQSPSTVAAAYSPPERHVHAPSLQTPETQDAPAAQAEPAGSGAGHAPATQLPVQQSESLLQLPWARQHVCVLRLHTDDVQYESDSQ